MPYALNYELIGRFHYESERGTQKRIPKADIVGRDYRVFVLAYVNIESWIHSARLLIKNAEIGTGRGSNEIFLMRDARYGELAMKKEHEKRVCKAVIDIIKKRKNVLVDKIEYPDEKEHNKQAVDVLLKCSSGEIVLEHTQIESYSKQIEDWSQIRKLLTPLKAMLAGKLPTPGQYELVVDVGATKGAKSTKRIQEALIKWIKKKAPLLQLGSPDVAPEHFIREKPDGVPFEVTLYRWPGSDGKLWIVEDAPSDLEEKRRKRISEALQEKCPKLWRARGDNRTSILVLELDDISLGNHIWVGKDLEQELVHRSDTPDEIYLVRTEQDEWAVWILKEGVSLFRDVADPGPYYI